MPNSAVEGDRADTPGLRADRFRPRRATARRLMSESESLPPPDAFHVPDPSDPSALLRQLMAFIETLFPDGWIAEQTSRSRSRHTAVQQWKLCEEVVKRGKVDLRGPRENLQTFGRILLDTLIWATVTRGDHTRFSLGPLSAYGDDAVVTKIRSRIGDSNQYDDLLVELSEASWLLGRGYAVVATESPGMPDLRAEVASQELPVYVECKHLKVITQNAVSSHIRKANKQLKRPEEDHYGVLRMHVQGDFTGELGDDIPDEIADVMLFVGRAVRGEKNRSVSAVIVSWDSYVTTAEEIGRPMIILRRHCETIVHNSPNARPLPADLEMFGGYTTMTMFTPSPPVGKITDVVITARCMQESIRRLGIPQDVIVEVVNTLDGTDWFVMEEAKLVLLSKHRMVGSDEGFILVFARVNEPRIEVLWALWVSRDLEPDVGFMSPLHVISELAYHCGIPFRLGESDSAHTFVNYHQETLPPAFRATDVVRFEGPPTKLFRSSIVQMQATDHGRKAVVAMVFALDLDRYKTPFEASG